MEKLQLFLNSTESMGLQDLKLEKENFDSCHNFFVLLFGPYKTVSEGNGRDQGGQGGATDSARTEIDEQLTTSCERAAALSFRVL